jgi:hypothetical protein
MRPGSVSAQRTVRIRRESSELTWAWLVNLAASRIAAAVTLDDRTSSRDTDAAFKLLAVSAPSAWEPALYG